MSVSLVEPELDGEPGPSEAETRQAPASVGDDVPSGDGDGAVEAVADVIRHALALGASTVQLSSQPRGVVARCRVDGTLRALGGDAAQLSHAALADLAEAAGVDPWTRTPREGLLALANGEDSVALRATVLPTRLGLQVVLRVPGRHGVPSTLSELGLHSSVEASLRDALRQPSGALVVCGHALSGRTTTLYAVLHELTTADRALVTVEHPVERLVAGVDQLEPDLAAGATFAQGVRAAIRADADVLLVGDLRDEATAEVAFRGARSERVVLTSLDCPTAARAAARLARLGVDGSLAASTLTALVAQSLLRRVCPDCRETYYANAEEIAELGRPEEESGRRLLARGRGCESCSGTGYRGSVAVFEALPLTDDVRGLVAGGAPAEAIRDAALAAGMSTLRDEAVGLCLDGVTTPSEVRLVTTD